MLGDRHFNAFLRRQPDRGFGREDPFCDHSVHVRDDVSQLSSFAKFDAHRAIARKIAGTSQDQVAEAGESGHGVKTATASDC